MSVHECNFFVQYFFLLFDTVTNRKQCTSLTLIRDIHTIPVLKLTIFQEDKDQSLLILYSPGQNR